MPYPDTLMGCCPLRGHPEGPQAPRSGSAIPCILSPSMNPWLSISSRISLNSSNLYTAAHLACRTLNRSQPRRARISPGKAGQLTFSVRRGEEGCQVNPGGPSKGTPGSSGDLHLRSPFRTHKKQELTLPSRRSTKMSHGGPEPSPGGC